jgi:gamma-glutamylcysteine synthetase
VPFSPLSEYQSLRGLQPKQGLLQTVEDRTLESIYRKKLTVSVCGLLNDPLHAAHRAPEKTASYEDNHEERYLNSN